jgi:hypothetical protein
MKLYFKKGARSGFIVSLLVIHTLRILAFLNERKLIDASNADSGFIGICYCREVIDTCQFSKDRKIDVRNLSNATVARSMIGQVWHNHTSNMCKYSDETKNIAVEIGSIL